MVCQNDFLKEPTPGFCNQNDLINPSWNSNKLSFDLPGKIFQRMDNILLRIAQALSVYICFMLWFDFLLCLLEQIFWSVIDFVGFCWKQNETIPIKARPQNSMKDVKCNKKIKSNEAPCTHEVLRLRGGAFRFKKKGKIIS